MPGLAAGSFEHAGVTVAAGRALITMTGHMIADIRGGQPVQHTSVIPGGGIRTGKSWA